MGWAIAKGKEYIREEHENPDDSRSQVHIRLGETVFPLTVETPKKDEADDANEKPCYFIKSKVKIYHDYLNLLNPRFNLFLNDPTIQILSRKTISMSKWGLPNQYEVLTYKPKFKQPCYSNNFNPYVVDQSIHDLLIEAKDVLKEGDLRNAKLVSVNSKYNQHKEPKHLLAFNYRSGKTTGII